MKNVFTQFLNKPLLVIGVSLVVAAGVGVVGYQQINKAVTYQFVKAEAGSIGNLGTADGSGTEVRHITLGFLASGRITNLSVKVGDTVKKGQLLATLDPESTAGVLTQARAAYASALANYDKVVNGATSPDIEVNKAALASAQTALSHSQEDLTETLNENYISASNAVSSNTNMLFRNSDSDTPLLYVAGVTFTNQSLEFKIESERVAINHLLSSWKDNQSVATAHANLETVGSYLDDLITILTSDVSASASTQATVTADLATVSAARAAITNATSALTNASQAVSTNQAAVTQAQATLTLKTSAARPEDVAAAQAQVSNAAGAVQIASAAYTNRTIVAPGDGTVTAVYISLGQTATPATSAIDLKGMTFSKDVAVMIPNNSITVRGGKSYVLLRQGDKVTEKEITVGVSDAANSEVLSGLSVGDEVATH